MRDDDQDKRVLDQLTRNYVSKLPEQARAISRCWAALCENPEDAEALKEVYGRVHRMYGASGTFGLHVLHEVLQPLHNDLRDLVEAEGVPEAGDFVPRKEMIADLEHRVAGLQTTEPGSRPSVARFAGRAERRFQPLDKPGEAGSLREKRG